MSSVRYIRRQELLQKTSPPKLLAEFLSNLAVIFNIWPSFIIVQIVPVRCITTCRSTELKIDAKTPETTRPVEP